MKWGDFRKLVMASPESLDDLDVLVFDGISTLATSDVGVYQGCVSIFSTEGFLVEIDKQCQFIGLGKPGSEAGIDMSHIVDKVESMYSSNENAK